MAYRSADIVNVATDAAPVERELVLRTQRGETEAFDALVRRHLPAARSVARRLMRDADDADDLVQESFLRALEKIDTFDADRPFGPWLIRIVMNAGVDAHRRRTVRGTEAERSDVASTLPTPDRHAEGAEIRARFDDALAKLPPRQRVIVAAFEVDGMSTEEIAGTLGVSQVTVRWHLHQGRRTLREALAALRDA